MNLISRTALILVGLGLALVAATAVASAQEAMPAPEATPTLMDREYDGALHITVAPYIWGSDRQGKLRVFDSAPAASWTACRNRGRAGRTDRLLIEAELGRHGRRRCAQRRLRRLCRRDLRKRDYDRELQHVGRSARRDRVIPISLGLSARLATSIWEAAAGYTVARGHDADLSIFMGLRQFPVNLTMGYNATVGKRGRIAPSGTVGVSSFTSDIITGLRGKAFVGDGHFFVPYYIDVGTGNSNQSWEGYTGAGYAFNHGQTLVVDWRSLNFYGFTPVSRVQKVTMYGPLLGYTFNI